jgi:23S rRNA pseudouridine2605 synthase
MERLQKVLAHAGVSSRRKAEELITSGAVTVNGQPVTELGVRVDERRDRVEVNGRRIWIEEPLYRLLLKPRACLSTLTRDTRKAKPATASTEKDKRKSSRSAAAAAARTTKDEPAPKSAAQEAARPTLARYVSDRELGWQVVAPLDYLAEGVLLLTTDGALAERMSRGGGRVLMTYHLKFQGLVKEESLNRLARGWTWEGKPVRPIKVEALATTGKNSWVEMVVAEARPRALKAGGELIRHTLLKISRVRLGEMSFESLKMGDWRDLTKGEIETLLASAGVKR